MKFEIIPQHVEKLILTYTATSLLNAGLAIVLLLILINTYLQGVVFSDLVIYGVFIELIILFATVLAVSFYMTGQGIRKQKIWVGRLILFRYKHSPFTKNDEVKELEKWFKIKS